MSDLVIVYCLFGNAGEAETAARDAVERRLAACANMLAPCTSFYIWEGAAEKQQEFPVLFKTVRAGRAALMAHLAAHHSYRVPAIESWDIAAATDSFARWVGEAVATDR